MDYKKQELIEDNNFLKLDKKKYNYNIELKNFTKEEQNKILLSKKYKFDN